MLKYPLRLWISNSLEAPGILIRKLGSVNAKSSYMLRLQGSLSLGRVKPCLWQYVTQEDKIIYFQCSGAHKSPCGSKNYDCSSSSAGVIIFLVTEISEAHATYTNWYLKRQKRGGHNFKDFLKIQQLVLIVVQPTVTLNINTMTISWAFFLILT